MVLEGVDVRVGEVYFQHMIESSSQINKATSSWWRWLFWIPSSRRIVRELVRSLEDVPTREKITRDRIHALEVELAVERQKTARMSALETSSENAVTRCRQAEDAEHRAWIELDSCKERCKTLEGEASAARTEKMAYEGQLVIRDAELQSARFKIMELEQHNSSHKEALAHVGRFIATSHRITSKPLEGTIKEILNHAQSRRG